LEQNHFDIIIFLADGFEEMECVIPADIFRRAGLSVLLVSITSSLLVRGSHDILIQSDIMLNDITGKGEEFDAEKFFAKYTPVAIFFPGGMPGSANLQKSEKIIDLVKTGFYRKILISALCAAPIVLNKAGILDGKMYTCFPGYEKEIIGQKVDSKVVVDETIITGDGPGSAFDFALKMVSIIKGEVISKNISQKMGYKVK